MRVRARSAPVKHLEMTDMTTTLAEWWGFSKDHGWVILDREIPCNTPGTRGELMFFRCRDEKIFFLKWELWKLPAYQYAPNHLRALPEAAAAEARAEYEDLVSRWPELQRELKRQYQELEDTKDKATREEEKRQKETAAAARKQRAAAARSLKVVADAAE
jgi:hypothetical protein